jgi:hypothetical protein
MLGATVRKSYPAGVSTISEMIGAGTLLRPTPNSAGNPKSGRVLWRKVSEEPRLVVLRY